MVGPLTLLPIVVLGCGVDAAGQSTPDWFENRPALPACAEVDLDQGELVPDSAATCLFGGRDGTGRELVVRSPTTEGDSVHTYYRQLPGVVGLDVITNATQDQNGSVGWHWETCPQAVSLTDIGGCDVNAVEPR